MNIERSAIVWFFIFSLKDSLCHMINRKTNHKIFDDLAQYKVDKISKKFGSPIGESYVQLFLVTSTDGSHFNHTLLTSSNTPKLANTEGIIFFLIHGWSQSRRSCPWYKPLTEVLLKKLPNSQVVEADYEEIASNRYTFAAFKADRIAHSVASAIELLVMKNNFPVNKIVIIGHSLGGQIAGWVGKKFNMLTNMRLPRIIALDPAAPIFVLRPESRRLNKDDADAVFVIHTDIINYGYPTDCGTIDFYPNGGFAQPGCNDSTGLDYCNHRKAHDFFIEALKQPQDYLAVECGDYLTFKDHQCDRNPIVSMGDWQTSETGAYYLKTIENSSRTLTDTPDGIML